MPAFRVGAAIQGRDAADAVAQIRDAETAGATEGVGRAVPVGKPALWPGVRTPAMKAVRGIGAKSGAPTLPVYSF